MEKKCTVIGICGGSGAGKTTVARTLISRLGKQLTVLLEQDRYYRDQSHLFDGDGGSVNFDHPASIDFDLLAEHLTELKSGRSAAVPIYDFATHKRLAATDVIPVSPVVVVEGTLILHAPQLQGVFDYSCFIEVEENIRFSRRLARDMAERGRTAAGVKQQFLRQVKPMHDEFVEPSKRNAGSILRESQDIEVFLGSLTKALSF